MAKELVPTAEQSASELELLDGRPRVAESLEQADARSLVYLGSRGQVRSPAVARAQLGLTYGLIATLQGALLLWGWWLLGPVGLAASGVFAVFVLAFLRRAWRLRPALERLVADDLPEAERIAGEVYRARSAGRLVRAQAAGILARVAAARGEFDGALELQREARSLQRRVKPDSVQGRLLAYGEVVTLVNLGRLEEAERTLAAVGEAPEGDYLRMQHWTAQMYLAFAHGAHEIDESDLHERGRVGLMIVPGATLLGLVAWAFERIGDAEMSEHLLETTLERWVPPVSRGFPLLDRWLRGRAAARGVP